MRPAFTLLLVLAHLYCFAQQAALRIEPANVTKEVVVDDLEEGYQDITHITVTNTSERTLTVAPEQVTGKKPSDWTYGTYSRRNQSAPFVLPQNKEEAKQPVTLNPGESASFAVVLDSEGVTGQGTVGLIFTDRSLPGVTLGTANFTTRIVRRATATNSAGSQINRPRRPIPTTVNLYPNPARERFFIEAPAGVRLGRIDVANALGKRLKSFDKPNGEEGYDIEKLPDGLYLISIYDDRGKKLKTLRLLHRRFGA